MSNLYKACTALISFSVPMTYSAADDLLETFKALKPEVAIELAQATMEACRKGGFQVAVAIVDRSGVVQVMLRDQLAGPHTLDTARRKAWTAASFNADTRSIGQATRPGSGQSGARFVSEAMMVGGGVPLYGEGVLVGAVGVSGAPSADDDQGCAEKAASALEEMLLF